MRYLFPLIAWSSIILVVAPACADGVYDLKACKSDCVFRYNVKRDYAGAILLPTDSQSREGYLKCIQKCENEFWGDMSGPGDH